MHHSKLPAATNASSDNLNSGHPTAAGISSSVQSNTDETQQQPLHCALSREASLKKGSDGKIQFRVFLKLSVYQAHLTR